MASADLQRLDSECRQLRAFGNPAAPLSDLIGSLRNRIATREPLGIWSEPDIRIVTLWGAKGLTADYVHLVGLCDEALPGPYDPEDTDLDKVEYLEEQKRLLYVSLTRAKTCLVI